MCVIHTQTFLGIEERNRNCVVTYYAFVTYCRYLKAKLFLACFSKKMTLLCLCLCLFLWFYWPVTLNRQAVLSERLLLNISQKPEPNSVPIKEMLRGLCPCTFSRHHFWLLMLRTGSLWTSRDMCCLCPLYTRAYEFLGSNYKTLS